MLPQLDNINIINTSNNSLSDPLQALRTHIYKNNTYISDIDLYFNTLVVNYY
jgi:hypothetical protein